MSDLIDREAVREFIKSYSHSTDVVYHMEKHLYEVPTIDAVPVVHGRWKKYPDCGVTVCSACGWSIEECFYDPTTLKPYPYCPNCGAKMEG